MTEVTQHPDVTLQNIIQRITENLAVEEIYLYPFHTQDKLIHQLHVLLRHEGGQEIVSARALCNVVVSEKVGYQAYVLFPEDVNRQLNEGNIRVALIYHPNNRVYENPNPGARVVFPKVNYEKRYKKAVQYFEKEISKLHAFEEGFQLYMDNGNCSQASFMLHQVLELGFRLGENIIVGKAKMTHSIRKHQAYIRTFSPEMGSLFAEVEWDILQKLDESYSSARYDHDFSISKEDLLWAADKAKALMVYLAAFNQDLIDEIERHKDLTTSNEEAMPVVVLSDGAVNMETPVNGSMSEMDVAARTINKIGELDEASSVMAARTANNHRDRILSAISTYFTPTHVLCFAHQSRQEHSKNLVTSLKNESNHHRYYLVILTEEQPDQALHKQHQVNGVLEGELEVVALYFKRGAITSKLEGGQRFFHHLLSTAEVWVGEDNLLDSSVRPEPIDVEKLRWAWKQYFWKAEGLIKMTADHIGSRYDECCSLVMSQAMEQLCLSLLYAFLGYRPDNSLNLMYLIQLTESITPLAANCFCLDIPEERDMVLELSKALSEFRYNPNFDANGYSLYVLYDRLLTFSKKIEELVDEHFNALELANQ